MSTGAYIGFGNEQPTPYTPAENLTGYEGRAMRIISGNSVGPCSLTDQDTTQALAGEGVLIEGGPAETGIQVRIVTTGVVKAIAGTGGVAKGALVVPEYAASGLDRGRFIDIATADLDDLDMVWGSAMSQASEDGEFYLELAMRRQPLDGTGA